MSAHTLIDTLVVVGAGTMGSGIAQCAAQSGFHTLLYDSSSEVLDRAYQRVRESLEQLQAKGKLTPENKDAILQRLHLTNTLDQCRAPLIIEAIIETLEAKVSLFQQLDEVNGPDTIFASNTSSLSMDAIQERLPHPGRVAGLHFFNPATLMKLVEVVRARHTTDATIHLLTDLCRRMGKTPVHCTDAPGFIVNRVARHYYLEAMRIAEPGAVDLDTIDRIMEASGFRMGPFRLMDLIGNDINLAVSRSLYEAFGQEPRFAPSRLQIEKVENGTLGRKTGSGFYQYPST